MNIQYLTAHLSSIGLFLFVQQDHPANTEGFCKSSKSIQTKQGSQAFLQQNAY